MSGNIQWSSNGWMDSNDYKAVMSEFGRKGGLARAKQYKPAIAKAINLYVNHPELNQEEIAKRMQCKSSFR